jgi:prepilin-type N-terminal cleavage/methylation domain-containing protein/prepilin-type processing-associated H-X9-DG protein
MMPRYCSDRRYRDIPLSAARRLDKPRPGFTLVELLVVIAVMVILAGILFPVLQQARQAARRANCLSNLHQLGIAHRMYVQDFDDTLPYWYTGSLPHVVLWPAMLQPYYRSAGILHEAASGEAKPGEVWTADYALCAWDAGGKGTWEKPDWLWPGAIHGDPQQQGPMHLAAVLRPTDTLQIADGGTFYAGIYPGSRIRSRHQRGMRNGVFLDGHARVVSDELWGRIGRDERGYFYWIAAANR